MAREYRVLTALSAAGAPVPATFALCTDSAIAGAPFYVMEYRPGPIMGELATPSGPGDAAGRVRLSLAVVGALVQLHQVDYEAAGLGDFGRPEGYLERQLRRWCEQWERSKTREVQFFERLVSLMRESLPVSPAPTVVHGDYRLGNIVLNESDWSLDAILDWEMATLGDPLADLGWLLMSWGEPGDPDDEVRLLRMGDTFRPGFLTRAEIVAEYGRLSGRDVSAASWYEAFAHFKRAVVIEGIHNRFLQGLTVGAGFENYGHADYCLGYALKLMSGPGA
jgi:aminoglycoside phosphotransferase (APT) family kinase protein